MATLPLSPETPVVADSIEGRDVLVRSAILVVAEAVNVVTRGGQQLVVLHGNTADATRLFPGVCATIVGSSSLNATSDDIIAAITARVQESVAAAQPIQLVDMPHAAVEAALKAQGSTKGLQLIRSINAATYRCHVVRGFVALALDGQIATPTTALCGLGDNIEVLSAARADHNAPNSASTPLLWIRMRGFPPILPCPGVHTAIEAALRRAAVSASCIGEINQVTATSQAGPGGYVEAEERRFVMAVMDCAHIVARRGPDTKLVLISGPSASGKTTFSHLLALALRTMGREPAVLSTDDYYRAASEPTYPRTPEGKPNHEVVDCMRTADFARDVKQLFLGEEVETPIFDMKNSRPKEHGRKTKLSPNNGILIMEGIFALDRKMTEAFDPKSIFRVFIIPMPVTNVDDLSMISNQTVRCLRRIARDFKHRGRDASASIARNPTVRLGEETGILPNVVNADYVFNSAMGHELGVLRVYCDCLLKAVKPGDPSHATAQRLLNLLSLVAAIPEAKVPPESLLREFIGGSVFDDDEAMPSAHKGGGAAESPLAPQASMISVPPAEELLKAAAPPVPLTVSRVIDQLSTGSLATAGKATSGQSTVIAALVNGQVASLNEQWPSSRGTASLEAVYTESTLGRQIQRDTLGLLLKAAAHRHGWSIRFRQALDSDTASGDVRGVYFTVAKKKKSGSAAAGNIDSESSFSSSALGEIKSAMRSLVAQCAPVTMREISYESALALFASQADELTVRLLQSGFAPTSGNHTAGVNIVECDGVAALAIHPLAPHAGLLSSASFDLFFNGTGGDSATQGAWLIVASSITADGGFDFSSTPYAYMVGQQEAIRRRITLSHGMTFGCVGEMNDEIALRHQDEHSRIASALDAAQVAEIAARLREEAEAAHRNATSGGLLVLVGGAANCGKSMFAANLVAHIKATSRYPCTLLNLDALNEAARNEDGLRATSELLAAQLSSQMGTQLNEAASGTEAECALHSITVVEGTDAIAEAFVAQLSSHMASQPWRVFRVHVAALSVTNIDEIHMVEGEMIRSLRCVVDAQGTMGALTAERTRGENPPLVASPSRFDSTFTIANSSSALEIHALAPRATTQLRRRLKSVGAATSSSVQAQRLLALLSLVASV